ncbi:MAG: hypothetical protein EZS28_054468, partial [Streblomastix strix]
KEKQAKGAKRQASEGFIPLSQIEHDVRMAWAEDRHKTKEKDNTVDQKESRQQELLKRTIFTFVKGKQTETSCIFKTRPPLPQETIQKVQVALKKRIEFQEQVEVQVQVQVQVKVQVSSIRIIERVRQKAVKATGPRYRDRKKKFQTRVSESKEQMAIGRTRQEVER